MEKLKEKKRVVITSTDWVKFILLSAFGIFMFFVPITIGEKSTIPLDHVVSFIKGISPSLGKYYALIVIILGAIYPFYNKSWNKDKVTVFFSVAKVVGMFVAFMAIFNVGPAWMFEKDMVPFLYDKLVISVGMIVPVGAVFLAFLVGYGLLEFIGVIMQPVMKPIWKTPGRSAIDAVASFVGSYSIGLLITNRVYKEGKYSAKEAAIIATGFSTVSATFMIIVAKTLGLMDMWNFYFWSTLVITFVVTALTVRIFPLSKKSDKNYFGEVVEEEKRTGNIFKNALDDGLEASHNSLPLLENIKTNFIDGFKMAMGILPSILSIGLLGLILAKYTPVFDIVGYIFYPFTALLQIPDAMLVAKASGLEVAEMFLPALLVKETALLSRYVIGVVSVSSVLFFSASIPCIVSTEIPLTMKDIIIVWIERTIFGLILAAAMGHLFL
ncbi:YjiH family protein [Acidaminobacter sp. JC074]|uniref:YjiH family protein n=1 Tax=Acidaminobacter sp. JC074 TaxID=2530199 RepID=UPI001F10E689|nr:YjiH family protein [Acidaminobacter sp. JC074]MCH4889371.1 YjiH family protein [Acidaminobacter sp. JC074]